MKVIIKQHPGTGLWVTSDGRVILPPCKKYPKFRFTFGHKNSDGYLQVGYLGKTYKVHRLICETFHGLVPEDRPTCDHINRDKTDNRLENLRFASYKMQADNTKSVDRGMACYGVRRCNDPAGYRRARYAKDPEVAERERAYQRERRLGDPDFVEYHRLMCHEYEAKQRALGRVRRRCPDGKRKWLTREEFFKEYGYWPKK